MPGIGIFRFEGGKAVETMALYRRFRRLSAADRFCDLAIGSIKMNQENGRGAPTCGSLQLRAATS